MSVTVATPLLDNTIEPDEPTIAPTGNISSNKTTTPRAPVVLTPTSHNASRMATTEGDAEDRDAKQKWANNMGATWGLGGLGGQLLAGAVKNSVGRAFQR
ncbi:hypothetical protein H0H92_014145 [Tricholoma furcatifolium]|nr:hypothetical protein H0H92_014145 [Tricholoma furcatifolium]